MEQNIEEISLREIIEIVLRGKKIIIYTTLIAIIASALISLFVLSPTYQVTTALIVKNIKGAESSSVIGSLMNEQEIPINTLISAFDNAITGPKMLAEVRKISPEWEEIQSTTLKEIIKVELVKDTTNVNITVSAHTPKDAVTLANIVTFRFKQYVEDQNYDTLASKVQTVKRQMEVDINLIQDKIKKSEEELNNLDQYIVYKKSIVEDPYLQELAARLGNTSVVNLSNLSVENEEPNPAYLKMLDDVTNNKLALSNLESQYAELTKAEAELKEIAKETGMKASIVRDVIEPENPISPNKKLNVAIAAVLGFMVSVFYVFFMDYWRSSGRKEEEINQTLTGISQ